MSDEVTPLTRITSIQIEQPIDCETVKITIIGSGRAILYQFESSRPIWMHVWSKILAYVIAERL